MIKMAANDIRDVNDTVEQVENELISLLVPKDVDDDKNAILEVRAGKEEKKSRKCKYIQLMELRENSIFMSNKKKKIIKITNPFFFVLQELEVLKLLYLLLRCLPCIKTTHEAKGGDLKLLIYHILK